MPNETKLALYKSYKTSESLLLELSFATDVRHERLATQ